MSLIVLTILLLTLLLVENHSYAPKKHALPFSVKLSFLMGMCHNLNYVNGYFKFY